MSNRRPTPLAIVAVTVLAIVVFGGALFMAQRSNGPIAPKALATPATPQWPAGRVGMSVAWTAHDGVRAGDRVDIVATVDTRRFRPANPYLSTRTVYTGVLVADGGPPQFRGLYLLISICDAEFLLWFENYAAATYLTSDPFATDSAGGDSCPYESGMGMSPREIDARWHFTSDRVR